MNPSSIRCADVSKHAYGDDVTTGL